MDHRDTDGRVTWQAAPLVDEGVLDALRESVGGDEAFVRELVESWVAEASTLLDALSVAVAGEVVTDAGRAAHSLKSSSAVVGAMRISEICRSIEATSREGRLDGLAERLAAVQAAWSGTLGAFRDDGLVG